MGSGWCGKDTGWAVAGTVNPCIFNPTAAALLLAAAAAVALLRAASARRLAAAAGGRPYLLPATSGLVHGLQLAAAGVLLALHGFALLWVTTQVAPLTPGYVAWSEAGLLLAWAAFLVSRAGRRGWQGHMVAAGVQQRGLAGAGRGLFLVRRALSPPAARRTAPALPQRSLTAPAHHAPCRACCCTAAAWASPRGCGASSGLRPRFILSAYTARWGLCGPCADWLARRAHPCRRTHRCLLVNFIAHHSPPLSTALHSSDPMPAPHPTLFFRSNSSCTAWGSIPRSAAPGWAWRWPCRPPCCCCWAQSTASKPARQGGRWWLVVGCR